MAYQYESYLMMQYKSLGREAESSSSPTGMLISRELLRSRDTQI